jgi:hypothetical protein
MATATQVQKNLQAAMRETLCLQDRFVAEPLFAKTGRGHLKSDMGSTELAANLFRATQTEEKLRRENVRNKDHANRIHNEVGRKVPKTIHELGGTMPEINPEHMHSRVYSSRIVNIRNAPPRTVASAMKSHVHT